MSRNQGSRVARTVLSDADTKSCSRCGEHAAVRARVADAASTGFDPSGDDKFVWYCFECGHEEPVAAAAAVNER